MTSKTFKILCTSVKKCHLQVQLWLSLRPIRMLSWFTGFWMPPWGHSLRKDAKYNFAGLTYWQPKVFLLKHVQDHQDPVQPHLFGLTPQPPFYLLILPNTIYWPACFTAGKNWIPKCMSPMSLLPKRPLRHSRTMKPHHPQNYPPDTMQACKSYWSLTGCLNY